MDSHLLVLYKHLAPASLQTAAAGPGSSLCPQELDDWPVWRDQGSRQQYAGECVSICVYVCAMYMHIHICVPQRMSNVHVSSVYGTFLYTPAALHIHIYFFTFDVWFFHFKHTKNTFCSLNKKLIEKKKRFIDDENSCRPHFLPSFIIFIIPDFPTLFYHKIQMISMNAPRTVPMNLNL